MIAYWDDFCISSPSRILFSAFRLEFPHTMTNYGEPGTEIPTAEALGWALADHRWLRHPFRHLAARMRGSLHTGGSAPEIRSVQRFDPIWIPIWGVEHMEFGPKPSIGISLSLSPSPSFSEFAFPSNISSPSKHCSAWPKDNRI